MERRRLGFIGAGNMATAMLGGVLGKGGLEPELVRATDPLGERREAVAKEFGITTLADNLALCDWADVLVLAVKPQAVDALLRELADRFRAEQLLISVCAGVTVQRLGQPLLKDARVVRAMPNTPALVGAGATAFAAGASASGTDRAFARALFECVGECVEVEERLLDAVTGLSGSGPAYVLMLIEALADGGVQAGLPRATAQQLALQTVFGTACLAKQSGEHPALLKDRVTSPGGTTIAGLHALETGGFRAALMNAVSAATRRSEELGKATK